MKRIECKDGKYTIHAPFDIGPRLMPSLKLGDDSRVSIQPQTLRDEEGRVVYRWFVDGPDGKELASGMDLRSGVGSDVDLDATFESFASFVNAWVESGCDPESDNGDLFPPSMWGWAEGHDVELTMLTITRPDIGKQWHADPCNVCDVE